MRIKNIFRKKQKQEEVQLLSSAQMLYQILIKTAWEQKRLARKLDVDEAQISRWLKGSKPRIENQRKIKNLYDEVMGK